MTEICKGSGTSPVKPQPCIVGQAYECATCRQGFHESRLVGGLLPEHPVTGATGLQPELHEGTVTDPATSPPWTTRSAKEILADLGRVVRELAAEQPFAQRYQHIPMPCFERFLSPRGFINDTGCYRHRGGKVERAETASREAPPVTIMSRMHDKDLAAQLAGSNMDWEHLQLPTEFEVPKLEMLSSPPVDALHPSPCLEPIQYGRMSRHVSLHMLLRDVVADVAADELQHKKGVGVTCRPLTVEETKALKGGPITEPAPRPTRPERCGPRGTVTHLGPRGELVTKWASDWGLATGPERTVRTAVSNPGRVLDVWATNMSRRRIVGWRAAFIGLFAAKLLLRSATP